MGHDGMKHRIRAAAIVVQDERILLVRHRTPSTGEEWWIPPGGGIEPEDGTIMDCAVRETFEEAGIRVECRRIAYIREFVQAEHDIRHMEFFLVGENPIGVATAEHLPEAMSQQYLVLGPEWLTREEVERAIVYPEILQREEFWADVAAGFPQVKYLSRLDLA
jgi:8-oxo-dGTP diphosphatase